MFYKKVKAIAGTTASTFLYVKGLFAWPYYTI